MMVKHELVETFTLSLTRRQAEVVRALLGLCEAVGPGHEVFVPLTEALDDSLPPGKYSPVADTIFDLPVGLTLRTREEWRR